MCSRHVVIILIIISLSLITIPAFVPVMAGNIRYLAEQQCLPEIAKYKEAKNKDPSVNPVDLREYKILIDCTDKYTKIITEKLSVCKEEQKTYSATQYAYNQADIIEKAGWSHNLEKARVELEVCERNVLAGGAAAYKENWDRQCQEKHDSDIKSGGSQDDIKKNLERCKAQVKPVAQTEPELSQGIEIVCGTGTIEKNGQCVPERVTMTTEMQQKSSNGGGCLIATATFGSELAPQVQQLRELRDNALLQTESGSAFMTGFNQFYYSFSPTIADWERQNPLFKETVKLTITPLISSLSLLNYVDMDSEAEVLGYGISLIILNIGMYVAAPVGLVVFLRRRV